MKPWMQKDKTENKSRSGSNSDKGFSIKELNLFPYNKSRNLRRFSF